MKHILVLALILGVFLPSYGANQTIKLGETFYSSNHVRAYYATTNEGKKIIYVTNKEPEGNEVVLPKSPVSKRLKTVRIRDASVFIAPKKLIDPATRNGIPVCIWRGEVISPIRVGDHLVCPSQRSPQAISPE